jgi:hypothetical protein
MSQFTALLTDLTGGALPSDDIGCTSRGARPVVMAYITGLAVTRYCTARAVQTTLKCTVANNNMAAVNLHYMHQSAFHNVKKFSNGTAEGLFYFTIQRVLKLKNNMQITCKTLALTITYLQCCLSNYFYINMSVYFTPRVASNAFKYIRLNC